MDFNDKRVIAAATSAIIIIGGICYLIFAPNEKQISDNKTNESTKNEQKVTELSSSFYELANSLENDKKIDIDTFLKKSLPDGTDIKITQEDESTIYQAKLGNKTINVDKDKSSESIKSLQYSTNGSNTSNTNSVDFFYLKPAKNQYGKEEMQYLTEEEKQMINNPTISLISNLYDYNSYNSISKKIDMKNDMYNQFISLINKLSTTASSITMEEAQSIVNKKHIEIINTTEYEEDCVVECDTYVYKNNEATLYLSIDKKTKKVWAIQYTEGVGILSDSITFKNRPLINASDSVKFFISMSTDSLDNIKTIMNTLNSEIK